MATKIVTNLVSIFDVACGEVPSIALDVGFYVGL